MAELVNLRRVRKTLERTRKQVAAAEARVRFGRPSSERKAVDREISRRAAHLDGLKLAEPGRLAEGQG